MKKIKNLIYQVIGSFIYSISVNTFTAPNNIAPGGVTGLSTMLNHISGIPIGTGMILFNTPLFIWAYKEDGKKVASTLSASLICSLIIDITSPFLPAFTGDLFLTSMFGGVFSGLGLGIILMSGATTGGSDLAANIISKKKPHISVGRLMLCIDCIIILISAVIYKSCIFPMYALIMVYITGKVIDTLIYGTKSGKLLFIISEKSKDISDNILISIERGVTKLYGAGAYTEKKSDILMCAVRRHEISKIYTIVNTIDKNAFIIISDAAEIRGMGFIEE